MYIQDIKIGVKPTILSTGKLIEAKLLIKMIKSQIQRSKRFQSLNNN